MQDAEEKSVQIEIGAGACRDHRANPRSEGDAVEDEAPRQVEEAATAEADAVRVAATRIQAAVRRLGARRALAAMRIRASISTASVS